MELRAIYVCWDCIPVIANADYTHLDRDYSPEEADRRMQAIDQGLERLGWVMVGDTLKDLEHSTAPCDCCGEQPDGYRIHCYIEENTHE
ncbi:hypothetical protein HNR62_000326 [Oceanisphaera litoralis]|uniref:hypothetical protein n=1 Tax=Oceanisphaera litoralis TaxID=225144 RepID=UPI00195E3B0B|nr:hypothetical protein [Oceanisphaera litoralis]MBM7454497.1 hypothetical protein [Oceanisphaera litoralis]